MIAVGVALIIFMMQLNWIIVRVDMGGLAGELLADVASHEDVWEILRTVADPDESLTLEDVPSIVELVDIFTDGLVTEIDEFARRIFAFDTTLTRDDVPDVSGIIDSFTELIMWEITRASSDLGEINQNISISDLPNIIDIVDFITDTIMREGMGWGMSPETVSQIGLDTEVVDTARFGINLLRGVFVVCTLLLVLFLFLLITGVKPACLFGQISSVIAILLAGGFALALNIGNRIMVEALGEHVYIGVGWYVYITLGLGVLVLVLTTVHQIQMREPKRV